MNSVDKYIAQFPEEKQKLLQELRNVMKEEIPEAEERISWAIPTFLFHGNLIHFAMHKNHIGLYPGVSAIEKFGDHLAEFKTSKGAIQFPLTAPFPFDLIRKILAFHREENETDQKK